MADFLIRAALAGFAVAAAAGVLGCFVLWRRMAYFGDALAHSSLLGVAMGLAVGASPGAGVFVGCFAFAAGLLWLEKLRLPTDAALGILAHSALAAGVIALSLLPASNVDWHAYLFGDILAVSAGEVAAAWAGVAFALAVLLRCWHGLVLMTVSEELAKSEGVNTARLRLLLIFLMTLVIALSVRLAGALLVTSLLLLPAATAKQFARSPEGMAALAALIGVCMVAAGIAASVATDIPPGPAIVAVGALAFAAAATTKAKT